MYKKGIYKILANEPLTASVWRMVLEGDTEWIVRPGQFVNIALEGRYLRRPISVCDCDARTLTLIYKVVGGGTEQMSRMAAGAELDLLTGLGNGFDTSNDARRPLLGMRIDVRCRKAVIANTMGGFSGAAVFPVAVRMVYQVAKACSVPVMGCGGVTTARDVIEMMMAGATAVQVGAANLVNPYASKEIVEALPAEMERLGIERLSDIIGIVE